MRKLWSERRVYANPMKRFGQTVPFEAMAQPAGSLQATSMSHEEERSTHRVHQLRGAGHTRSRFTEVVCVPTREPESSDLEPSTRLERRKHQGSFPTDKPNGSAPVSESCQGAPLVRYPATEVAESPGRLVPQLRAAGIRRPVLTGEASAAARGWRWGSRQSPSLAHYLETAGWFTSQLRAVETSRHVEPPGLASQQATHLARHHGNSNCKRWNAGSDGERTAKPPYQETMTSR